MDKNDRQINTERALAKHKHKRSERQIQKPITEEREKHTKKKRK